MRPISLLSFDLWLGLCVLGALLYAGLRGYDYFAVARVNDLLSFYRWGPVPRRLMPAYDLLLITVLGYTGYAPWGIGFFGAIIKTRDIAQVMGLVDPSPSHRCAMGPSSPARGVGMYCENWG